MAALQLARYLCGNPFSESTIAMVRSESMQKLTLDGFTFLLLKVRSRSPQPRMSLFISTLKVVILGSGAALDLARRRAVESFGLVKMSSFSGLWLSMREPCTWGKVLRPSTYSALKQSRTRVSSWLMT
jgi:hypothetical protein